MEQEVSDEVQAAMSLKLMENVRALIRDEIKLALGDPQFISQTPTHHLVADIIPYLRYNQEFKRIMFDMLGDRIKSGVG